ncbi:MFS transporter [Nocardioides sp. CER19]|uniref:MFS transporter n=1 Tax=Nocardioides sp. CER19 TaxID=3038538 RepID=UPI0024495990|nr:MFS transporter [Nocardioides sp. CER19]MDH2413465.1 MFS transporter [Nocardioides sp. CER19]
MGFATYAVVLKNPVVRRILLLGMLIRVPLWAANVVITLHVVGHLDRSYAQAGLVSTIVAIALSVSSPWRGRRLDRVGLRATVLPSIVIGAVAWSIAPWLGYWPLVVVAGFASLFAVPSFSIIRQVLIGHVPDHHRTTVLSVDSVATELTFLVGPVLGVLAATYLPTPVALLICQLSVVVGALILWIANPPLHSEHADLSAGKVHVRSWLSPAVVMVLVIAVTSTIILTGEDLATVAALRDWHQSTSIGWTLALWGAGSAIGGIVYGALHRHPSAAILLVGLAGTTALVAFAPDGNRLWFAALLTISGLFCAPTITATVDDLSRNVPASVRGEAMGWHGSALTLGSAIGAPIIGLGLDHGGWSWGFGLAGLAGLLIALPGLVLHRRGRPSRALPTVEEAAALGDAQQATDAPLGV